MRTQVAIIGAGPAGLLLSHLLHLAGLDTVVIEARSRAHVEGRIRAGVLESHVVAALDQAGVGARMRREGLPHAGTGFLFGGRTHRIDLQELTGRSVMVYGQHEVVRDLVQARTEARGRLLFECTGVSLDGFRTDAPLVRFTRDGVEHELACDLIAGCDGFHGPSRPSLPAGTLRTFDRSYPFGWLGILAEAPPSSDELVYANHERGFALHSMRTPELSRFYLQCAPDDDPDDWSDEQIWEELEVRLERDGFTLNTGGPIIEKGVTPMRSYVVEPMQHGNLFLAGDAAHIVPPTGAKGLNLAVADVALLADAIVRDAAGDPSGLDTYEERALRRVWRKTHFSWWMTSMLHTFGEDDFDHQLQIAQLQYVTSSESAATSLAENYTGMPLALP